MVMKFANCRNVIGTIAKGSNTNGKIANCRNANGKNYQW
jgi:hypothetical protein